MNIIHKIIRKISNSPYFYQWSIKVNFSKTHSHQFSDFINLIPPKDRFWADPFIIKKNGKYFIFIEEMLYSKDFGHISVVELNEDGEFKKPVTVIEKNYHLSYPFLFEFENEIYLIQSSTDKLHSFVELFKCIEFPYKWVSYKKILENIPLVDATIFYKDEKWWLFACEANTDGTSKSEKLLLYYSDNPLHEQWIAHPQNPIVSDIRKARPAGKIFKQGEKLIRPAQNCQEIYGQGFSFNEIIKLNENEYVENQLDSFEPTWDKNVIGMHTFNYDVDCTVIDFRIRNRKF